MNLLRWIHLSDIHFSGEEEYATKRMRDTIIEQIEEVVNNKKVNMAFITGDLSYQGGAYDANLKQFIDSLLNTLGISSDELFIVPGNHDLSRTQVRRLTIEGTRKDNFKFEKDTIEQLQKDFKKYNAFYKKVKGENADYIYKLINKGEYNVFLINTAFTAGTDCDEGYLILEKEAFFDEIHKLKDQQNCINIAIGHHPISCFSQECQQKIWNNFNDYNIDVYLCGHLHKAAYAYDLSGERTIPTFRCGSGRVDNYATVTFIIGELDIKTKECNLTSYKWLSEEECWAIGGIDGRRATSGQMNITLERLQNKDVTVSNDEDVDEDEFRRFMMKFHEQLNQNGIGETKIYHKDVFDKFFNMKCNKSVERQYHSLCRYFSVIDEIMESSLLTQIEKESIPNIVISEYNKVFGKAGNGNEIIELIVDGIFDEYESKFKYSDTKLKTYLKILVYWSIYECDIFNDTM